MRKKKKNEFVTGAEFGRDRALPVDAVLYHSGTYIYIQF